MRPTLGGEEREQTLLGWLGVAIIAITFHNAGTFFHTRPIPSAIVGTILYSGWVGISLFGTLIGLRTTLMMARQGDRDPKVAAFYGTLIRRAVPIYYLTLLVAFVLIPHFIVRGPWSDAISGQQVWYWTLLRNWAPGDPVTIDGFQHTWALGAAVPILIAWPPLVRYAGARGVACAVLLSLMWRLNAFLAGASAAEVYHSTLAWVDAVGLGSLAAFALIRPTWTRRVRNWIPGIVAASCTGIGIVVITTRGFSASNLLVVEVGEVFFALLSATLLFASLDGTARGALTARAVLRFQPLQLLGRHAFAIYVLHFPLHFAFMHLRPDPVATPVIEVLLRIGYDGLVLVAAAALAVVLGHAGRSALALARAAPLPGRA